MNLKILFTPLVIILISCKKDPIKATDETLYFGVPLDSVIIGKWNLVTDSTFSGVGSNNHPLNYTGQPGDYFDFNINGTLYTKEGNSLDTLSYEVISDTTMVIDSFGIILNGNVEVSQILNLTAHSVIINTPVELTPGGEFGRKVILNR